MPRDRPTVAVVGSVNLDQVIAVGVLPAPGQTVTGSGRLRGLGGKGANQAVAARAAGADVHLVAAISTDDGGRFLTDELRRRGIGLDGVMSTTRRQATAYVFVDHAGENQIVVDSESNLQLGASWVERRLAGLADDFPFVLLVSLEIPIDVARAAVSAAHRLGCAVILNPAPMPDSLPADLLAGSTYVTPNRVEAEQLLGPSEQRRDSRGLTEALAKAVAPVQPIITLGSEGVALLEDGEFRQLPAAASTVVSTVGAGDAFNGGLAAGLAFGLDLARAVEVGLGLAGEVVQVVDAMVPESSLRDRRHAISR